MSTIDVQHYVPSTLFPGYYPRPSLRLKPAPHLGHAKHLCNMAEQGIDLETVKKLVKNPKFICKKCGRVAAKEENLCEAVSL